MISLKAITQFVNSHIVALYNCNMERLVSGIAMLGESSKTEVDWINPRAINPQIQAEASNSSIIIASPVVKFSKLMEQMNKSLIQVDNPYLVIALIGNEFFVRKPVAEIHPTAIIDANANIGKGVSIGAYSVIKACVIGDNTIVSENVVINDSVTIGTNVYIKPGAILGFPGFSFVKDTNMDEIIKFPQLGSVLISDNVEIGSNTVIDRGALSHTIICKNVKISSSCHIAHNVRIGESSFVTAHVMISGSTQIGKDVWIGPNVTFGGHQTVGDGALIGSGSVVIKDIPANEVWAGNPARFIRIRNP
ncbi:MAG: UDP-3-O-(3-hydroxymyristoyl)glucosamine N-acyltransferase [Candidatus Cloacimonetes bacterium]|nr:UDP-3-O-(3-hydroxymyristoyl)glucosamine N-acyltransferase [Candidatus Cloacimonadota bacterium]